MIPLRRTKGVQGDSKNITFASTRGKIWGDFDADVRFCLLTQFSAPNGCYPASIEEDAAKLVGKLRVLTRLLHRKGVQ